MASRGIPHYEAKRIDLKVEVTPERVARGERFAKILCAECHMNPSTKQLTGKRMQEAPEQFGPIYSRNITKHAEKGIGSWTDGELAYLLRTGIARDGRYIPPYMAKLPHLADEDLYAIIAFLRSDSPLVEAAAVDPPGQTAPSLLTKLLANVAWKPLPYPERKIPLPNPADKVALGRYLVVNFECWTCHSADFKTINPMEPEKTPGFMGGGNPTLDLAGRVVPSANLTFDETGIGSWSEADFVRAVREGVTPKGKAVLFPMGAMPEIRGGRAWGDVRLLEDAPQAAQPGRARTTARAHGRCVGAWKAAVLQACLLRLPWRRRRGQRRSAAGFEALSRRCVSDRMDQERPFHQAGHTHAQVGGHHPGGRFRAPGRLCAQARRHQIVSTFAAPGEARSRSMFVRGSRVRCRHPGFAPCCGARGFGGAQ
ncbi:MAG: hypothetical protein QM778_21100 [Myxococcales bacterium]